MEQENGQIKSRCHSAAKEGAQTVQRPACLKYSLDSYRPYQQVKQQVKLSGWNGHNPCKGKQYNKTDQDRNSVGKRAPQDRGKEAAGYPPVVRFKGDEEGRIAFNDEVDKGDLDRHKWKWNVQNKAYKGQQHRINGFYKKHASHTGEMLLTTRRPSLNTEGRAEKSESSKTTWEICRAASLPCAIAMLQSA